MVLLRQTFPFIDEDSEGVSHPPGTPELASDGEQGCNLWLSDSRTRAPDHSRLPAKSSLKESNPWLRNSSSSSSNNNNR